ncbi:MAG: hypothetical protein J6P34_00690 [Paludibacteraceae bacterium]|nr:hypothetical protein [Paludibacteraceae bacterium]MBO7368172.1 hypothetical protein [Paludibacteraceae bacterium]
MKRLKFLIVVLGVFAAQGVMAVTLPTTSYTEYSSPVSYEVSGTSPGGIVLPSTSFQQLGSIPYDECTAKTSFQECEQCCSQKVRDCYTDPSIPDKSECNTLSLNCNNDCGRSLPLDAPLWFMVMSVVILSVAKNLVRRYRTVSES